MDSVASMLSDSPIYPYVPAADLERAKTFYQDVLGLELDAEQEGGVTVCCGQGTTFFLYETPNAGTSKASQVFWVVQDIESEVDELRAKGVDFERYELPSGEMSDDIMTMGDNKAAWFKDTEGNILALIQG